MIQEKKIVRLGSNQEINVDIRLVCATNKDIEKEIKRGRFRSDLYYRLNVLRIHLPPLRDRKEDIPLLTDHFIRIHAKKEKKPIKGITEDAMRTLLKYHFPGNVRELENIIERAVVLTRRDYITRDELPVSIIETAKPVGYGKLNATIARLEKQMITDALEKTNGNQTQAASLLGISERVLRYKIKKYLLNAGK